MNLRIRELAALMLVALLGPIVLHAQTLNPAYLSEMPAPARILAEIKGKNAEDTGERQMGAFMGLIKLMNDMAWGLEHRYIDLADNRKMTPDELRINLAYQTAYADLWHKVTNKEGHVYDHDIDLLNEMLQKFFSETFRAKYFQANRNAQAGYRAFQERMYGPQSNSSTSAAPTSRPSQPSTSSVASGRPPGAVTDPSIAKARAANVDTKVLGLQLGEPLQIPTCAEMFPGLFSGRDTTCMKKTDDLLSKSIEDALGVKDDPGAREHTAMLELSQDGCPSWVQGCEARLMTYDGLLVAIDLKTKGHNVDQAVAKELRAKYGPPSLVKQHVATPNVGNSIKVNFLEWMLPGLHVVYDVYLLGESEGEVADIETGNIGFETEAAYQRRLAKEKAKPKVKL
jgi:hypothetical protein